MRKSVWSAGYFIYHVKWRETPCNILETPRGAYQVLGVYILRLLPLFFGLDSKVLHFVALCRIVPKSLNLPLGICKFKIDRGIAGDKV